MNSRDILRWQSIVLCSVTGKRITLRFNSPYANESGLQWWWRDIV